MTEAALGEDMRERSAVPGQEAQIKGRTEGVMAGCGTVEKKDLQMQDVEAEAVEVETELRLLLARW